MECADCAGEELRKQEESEELEEQREEKEQEEQLKDECKEGGAEEQR